MKKIFLLYFVSLAFLATPLKVLGGLVQKEIAFGQITENEGLSSNRVICIYQDVYGYMWFGTANGLNRYDGHSFDVFKHSPIDTSTISNNYILAIDGDSLGNIWVGTKNGLNIYNWKSNSFTSLNTDDGLVSNKISTLLVSTNRNVFIGTPKGLNMIKAGSRDIQQISLKDKSSIAFVSMADNGQGIIYMGSYANKLYYYNEHTNKLVEYSDNDLRIRWVNDIAIKPSGELILSTENGLIVLGPDGKVNKAISHFSNKPTNSICIENNNLWVSVNHELHLLDLNSNPSAWSYSSPENNQWKDVVNEIYADNNEIVWLATWSMGIKYYDRNKHIFNRFYHPVQKSGQHQHYVFTISSDSLGNISIGTFGKGIFEYDEQNRLTAHINKQDGLPGDIITSLYHESNNRLWVGTADGLALYDKNKKTTLLTIGQSNGLLDNYIQALYKDSRGLLWVATREGLNTMKSTWTKAGSFSLADELPHYSVSQIIEDENNNIWFATEGGLSKYNPATGKIENFFKKETKNANGLSDNYIKCLYLDNADILWVGTENGLNKLNLETGNFTMFFESDGLVNNVIGSIQEDSHENIWIQTYSGISVYDKSKKYFRNYTESSGLKINSIADHVDKNGKFYYGGLHNGFYAFYPDSIKQQSYNNPIYITGLKKYGNEIIVVPGSKNRETIKIKYHEKKYIRFSFTRLNLTHPENSQIACKLEGFDNEWTILPARVTSMNYTNLPTGSYTFRIKALNKVNKPGSASDSLTIEILPVWWKTLWAYLVFALIFVLIFVLYRRISLRRTVLIAGYKEEQQKNRLKIQNDQMRMRLITNLVHEFRSPLTLVKGISEKIAGYASNVFRAKSDMDILDNNLKRIDRLLNQLVDLRKIDNNAFTLKVGQYNIEKEVKSVFDSFKIMAESKNIDYTCYFNVMDNNAWFDREILEKILFNLLSNAFKYNIKGGRIELHAYTDYKNNIYDIGIDGYTTTEGYETYVENPFWNESKKLSDEMLFASIIIKDNGQGISKQYFSQLFERFVTGTDNTPDNDKSTGIGLSYIKELAVVHRGILRVWSKPRHGSVFSFIFPVEKDIYEDFIVKSSEKDSLVEEDRVIPATDKMLESERENSLLSPNIGERKLVLVVEDNDDIRMYIKDLLSAEYEVKEASNGKEGLSKAQTLLPSLIITDIMMPEMNGLQFCSSIRQNFLTSHIPLIMLTAKSLDKSRIEGYEHGADEYIVKPFNAQVLVTRVNNLIASRIRLRETYRQNIVELDDKGVYDNKFLSKLKQSIENHLNDEDFNVESLASMMAMSRVQLNRKVKAVLDIPPKDLIRHTRMARAKEILQKNNEISVSELAFQLGFKTSSLFIKNFKEFYGKTPKDFLKE